jgi:ADP-ribosylglycohydrolase
MYPDDNGYGDPAAVDGIVFTPGKATNYLAGRQMSANVFPLARIGVQAYLRRGGRIAPEDYAELFREDEGIAVPAFGFDLLHSLQEVLKEGMNPRISGLLAAPCGFFAAAMPAVGLYHAADPAYAYLDGVEIASIAQGRAGADWCALCAAAIAAALAPEATADSVAADVLAVAQAECPDLYLGLRQQLDTAAELLAESREAFLAWFFSEADKLENCDEGNWIAYQPLRLVLPALLAAAGDGELLLALAISPDSHFWVDNGFTRGHPVNALVAGAILGALAGPDAFPAAWQAYAAPQIADLLPFAQLIRRRLETEREMVQVVDRLAATPVGESTLLEDRLLGNLLAGAIGNAMGSPVECMAYTDIDAAHPGGVTTVLDPSRLEGEDDNQMAMLLVDTYLERAGAPVMARHFGKTWDARLQRNHFFTLCMGHAYDLIKAGWDPRIIGHWKTVTGSTVMCMEPVGIYHLADPEFAYLDAVAVSYMYQRGLDVTAAAILAATVAEAFRPEATVDSILEAALCVTPRTPWTTFDRRRFASPHAYLSACLEVADKYDDVLAARAELYEKCLLYHCIDPMELWGLSLAMFKIANGDVRQAAIGGTNIGRDSDTIAGRAAMLSGTLRGAGNVPVEWAAMFSSASLERIQRTARQFAALLTGPKRARLQTRGRLLEG